MLSYARKYLTETVRLGSVDAREEPGRLGQWVVVHPVRENILVLPMLRHKELFGSVVHAPGLTDKGNWAIEQLARKPDEKPERILKRRARNFEPLELRKDRILLHVRHVVTHEPRADLSRLGSERAQLRLDVALHWASDHDAPQLKCAEQRDGSIAISNRKRKHLALKTPVLYWAWSQATPYYKNHML